MCLITFSAFSQPAHYNHPELRWQTIETEHFAVHFHPEAEHTARIVGGIAEQVYQPLTDLYGYRPDGKVHWIIRDHDDYANGATYYYDNKIEIWATPLDFELRGTHHWLYDVVTHEFAHMIQLGASRKGPRWLPGVYFQYIGYEPEKRPDVLYGFPNRLASWPVAMTAVPMWFAEGTAQFQARETQHDWWDSHRDMILRSRTLENKLLTWNEMGVFGKTTYGSESVYNAGYALVKFIADNWGEGALAELSQQMRSPVVWNFDSACRKVLGLSGQQLYAQWKREITAAYQSRTERIRASAVSGEVVQDEGFANLHPKFSSDGKIIGFTSNKGADYMSQSAFYLYDVEKNSLIKTDWPVMGRFDWSPDGRFIVYARKDGPNRRGSDYFDVFLWDTESETEIRLTKDARLTSPAFAPDGKSLVAVHTADGTQNLALIELPEEFLPQRHRGTEEYISERVPLTQFDDGRQIFDPVFAADGKHIVCSTSDFGSRDIYRYDMDSGAWEPVIATDADEREAVFSPDGGYLYYCGDKTGIFNLYRRDLNTGEDSPFSNVLGGAFMPAADRRGWVVYSEWTADGYGIRLMKMDGENRWDEMDAADMGYLEYKPHVGGLSEPPKSEAAAGAYTTPFSKLFFLPRVAWDYGRFKPGFYAYTSDMLEKLSLFGGVALGGNNDLDFYLNGEYRMLAPTLFVELFSIIRHNSERFDDNFRIIGERYAEDSTAAPVYDTYGVDYTYRLTEADLGGKYPLGEKYRVSAALRLSNYKAALDFGAEGSFNYTYFKGQAYLTRVESDHRTLSVANDIHPRGGWRGWVEYARENNRFLDGFEIESHGTIVEVYRGYNYHRLETDFDYYMPLFGDYVLNPRLVGGLISKPVDPFFHLYAGGLLGLRGYSFYSLGGVNKAVARLALRFPILAHIDRRWGPFYFDRVHAALFAEAGDAWEGKLDIGDLKRDVGAELRMKLFSWYGFPTDLQLAGAYGLDRFTVWDDFGGVNTYGREWRWYLTLLFDFI